MSLKKILQTRKSVLIAKGLFLTPQRFRTSARLDLVCARLDLASARLVVARDTQIYADEANFADF